MTKAMEVVTVENVRGYVDENGTIQLNAEDVARGLGFVKTEEKVSPTSGRKTYETIRWERVNGYLKEFGFSTLVSKDDYIPENMFYRLAMKASNATAQAFQEKVADVILPAIRKTGVYMTAQAAEKILYNPDFIIGLAMQVKEANAKIETLNGEVKLLEDKNAEMKPKADFFDRFLNSDETMPITYIAKMYSKGGAWLNSMLERLKVQHKVGKRWVLNYEYTDKGYTRPISTTLANGRLVTHTEWTNKGRLFIYGKLKEIDVVPEYEREENQLALFAAERQFLPPVE